MKKGREKEVMKKTIYNQVRRKQLKLQSKLAIQLTKDVGINSKRTFSIEDIKRIEKYLSIYQILIVSSKKISNLSIVVRLGIKKFIYFTIIITMITLNLCLLFLMKNNSASFVFNLFKMSFFTNASRYVNYVREKLVKKR
jgi:hypothetical protein